MMVMTAKVDKKKLSIILLGAVALLGTLLLLFGGGGDAAPTATTALSGNDSRVAFLKDLGWQVTTSPVTSGQVRIPDQEDPVFSRYNDLQKSAGYDLGKYAGKVVMRYVYQVTNYPDATEPVYATLLVYKDTVIGGDVTDTAPKGQMRSLSKFTPEAAKPTAPTVPAEDAAPVPTTE